MIQKELHDHAEVLSQLRRLEEHLTKLMAKLRKPHPLPTPSATCPPCEAHPEHPAPVFLSRLVEQLQKRCRDRPPTP